MGQIRSLLRGYAIDDPCPADVLRRTNAAVCQMLPEAVATAFYAVFNPASGDLAFANAGHPPPLCIVERGHAGYLDTSSGTMLGASAGTAFASGVRRLLPGTGLLLYTDGLIEDRHRDIFDGLTALIAAVRQSAGQTAEQTCQWVQTVLLGSASRADDVCILAVRRSR